MKTFHGLDGYDIFASALIAHAVAYLFYWLSGGNFDRDWKLALAQLGAFLLCGWLMEDIQQRRKAKSSNAPEPSKKSNHDTSYL